MSPTELLHKVEAYLKRTKETPTAFSRRVCGDPALVLKMRKYKRELRHDLQSKVLRAIAK